MVLGPKMTLPDVQVRTAGKNPNSARSFGDTDHSRLVRAVQCEMPRFCPGDSATPLRSSRPQQPTAAPDPRTGRHRPGGAGREPGQGRPGRRPQHPDQHLQLRPGAITVNARGDNPAGDRVDASHAQGLQVGDGNTQHNHFYARREVSWPHQIGVIPALADLTWYLPGRTPSGSVSSSSRRAAARTCSSVSAPLWASASPSTACQRQGSVSRASRASRALGRPARRPCNRFFSPV